MGSLEILLLVIVGLWIYSRCCVTEYAREYKELMDDEVRSPMTTGAGHPA